MKLASAFKYVSKSHSITKYGYIAAYKRWKSVMIIQLRISTKYIKLTESNMYKYIFI
jgi:hypothetical protein